MSTESMLHEPTIPPFDPEACCVKCGSDSVRTSYVATTEYACNFMPCHPRLHDYKDREHHHRTCQRCHFVWPEAVLDE